MLGTGWQRFSKLCGRPHQPSFAHAEFAAKKKTTRREKFLARMEEVIPWTQRLAGIEPHYPKGQRGRPPVGLERMLRVYFLQQWYGLADEALEDALYDSQALRDFARIALSAAGGPDATTLLNFRCLLETHALCKGLFTTINADLTVRGWLLREGTLGEATLIAAPSATKNEQKQRYPERHQTKKGNPWYFGMKAHSGADRAEIVALDRKIDWQIARKRGWIKALAEGAAKAALQTGAKAKASVRAFVEHPFHLVQNLFRHRQVRYRGLAKNGHQLDTLFGLANVGIGARVRAAA